MILAVDNGSRYTNTLTRYLEDLNTNFAARQPHQIDTDRLQAYSSFILSGRRSNQNHMNKVNSDIIRFAVRHDRPLLGICYGAEMLALSLGGTIRRMPQPVYGDVRVQVTQDNPLCTGNVSVFASHSYEISKIPPPLTSVGSSTTCHNEIIRYNNTLVFGVQFHPEMSPDGLVMIERFLREMSR
ncbi:MAG: glutamine amidotransferase [Cenarchaeum sp. SB0665_bin_23]|nr:glutamine amidotransferase [Cenarchaeum sp. SB0667_bin_13]MXY60952.1 glutamine amidotransferase [Cenarchaeum sp. SB0665_bin_23]MXZ93382.1 glutamine amidotransferase [Cenarchaeum sp. SB0666_bin_15]MYC79591.1 glutamine amidotransferase [Cenarchaeum sp. SB0661_bin_35]MYD58318.1 glutamine amidotransferase [Cenarchaeum sp. SB0678_bin_8]MYG33841.1 glutamine amidotransferase [Cenarchaeum sp. SB0677_bin_16]MYI51900.1 glutamine amidotransferase [Cenarchaeum sp. SB0673_bin_9]MYJ28086.1 glutamine am